MADDQYVDFALGEGYDPDAIAADVRTMRAAAGLINVTTIYTAAPEGSRMEQESEAVLNRALDELHSHPDHAAELVGALLTCIAWVQMGNTVPEFFARFGIKNIQVPTSNLGEESE